MFAPANSRIVLVFVRHPTPGAVKTRLAATLGADAAAALYAAMVEDIVGRLRAGLPSKEFTVVLYGTPADELARLLVWLNDSKPPLLDAVPQPDGTLAARLAHASTLAFGQLKARELYLVASDCPDLDRATLLAAARELECHDAVLGPARDGGFHTLGLRRDAAQVLRGVTYSTPQTGAQLTAALREAGFAVSTALPELTDIDEAVDFAHISHEARARLSARVEGKGLSLP